MFGAESEKAGKLLSCCFPSWEDYAGFAAREFGMDGVLVVRDRLTVFNELDVYCEFKRTTTNLTYVPR